VANAAADMALPAVELSAGGEGGDGGGGSDGEGGGGGRDRLETNTADETFTAAAFRAPQWRQRRPPTAAAARQ